MPADWEYQLRIFNILPVNVIGLVRVLGLDLRCMNDYHMDSDLQMNLYSKCKGDTILCLMILYRYFFFARNTKVSVMHLV